MYNFVLFLAANSVNAFIYFSLLWHFTHCLPTSLVRTLKVLLNLMRILPYKFLPIVPWKCQLLGDVPWHIYWSSWCWLCESQWRASAWKTAANKNSSHANYVTLTLHLHRAVGLAASSAAGKQVPAQLAQPFYAALTLVAFHFVAKNLCAYE